MTASDQSRRIGRDGNLEALAAYQKAEIEKWWPIVKAANMKGE